MKQTRSTTKQDFSGEALSKQNTEASLASLSYNSSRAATEWSAIFAFGVLYDKITLFSLPDTAGKPEQRHLARSGSQSQRRIRFILSTHGASHLMSRNKVNSKNRGYYEVVTRSSEDQFATKSPENQTRSVFSRPGYIPRNLSFN